jgi:hypothetical protein
MKVGVPSETLTHIYSSTKSHIPEDCNQRCKSLPDELIHKDLIKKYNHAEGLCSFFIFFFIIALPLFIFLYMSVFFSVSRRPYVGSELAITTIVNYTNPH